MKKILSILILSSIISCNNVSSTDKETNAVQQVLNFYGGECLSSKGVKFEKKTNKSYFELEVSKSELLDVKSKSIKTHSANIAYLFYSNLDNKKKYDDIRVKINLSDGNSQDFSYSNIELNEIEKLKPYLNQINEQIIKKKYERLIALFDKTINVDLKKMEELFNTIENQYGIINKVQLQGFEFRESENYGNVIIVKEALVLGKLSITMNLIFKREIGKIISIEIE